MAYTGTAPTVYLTLCEDPQPSPGAMIGGNCQTGSPIDAAVFFPPEPGIYIPDAQQLSELFTVFIYLGAMIFIIAMLKKAIEQ